ncbi:MAG: CPBP family intramembrane glutamic endopeptidase [Clostridiales bacterium]
MVSIPLIGILAVFGHGIAMLGPSIAAFIILKYVIKVPLPKWKWSKIKYYIFILLFFGLSWSLPGIIGVMFKNFEFNIPEYMIIYMIFYFFIIPFAGIGEEFGWSTFLLTYLPKYVSKTKAIIIAGSLRGLWHLPVLIGYPVYMAINGEKTFFEIIIMIFAYSALLVITNIIFSSAFSIIWFQTNSTPLVGWEHLTYDLTRDFSLLLILGYVNDGIFRIIVQVPFYIIGIVFLFKLFYNEKRVKYGEK